MVTNWRGNLREDGVCSCVLLWPLFLREPQGHGLRHVLHVSWVIISLMNQDIWATTLHARGVGDWSSVVKSGGETLVWYWSHYADAGKLVNPRVISPLLSLYPDQLEIFSWQWGLLSSLRGRALDHTSDSWELRSHCLLRENKMARITHLYQTIFDRSVD